jgi:hypothetical protein
MDDSPTSASFCRLRPLSSARSLEAVRVDFETGPPAHPWRRPRSVSAWLRSRRRKPLTPGSDHLMPPCPPAVSAPFRSISLRRDSSLPVTSRVVGSMVCLYSNGRAYGAIATRGASNAPRTNPNASSPTSTTTPSTSHQAHNRSCPGARRPGPGGRRHAAVDDPSPVNPSGPDPAGPRGA